MKTQKKRWFLVFVTLLVLLCGTGCGARISTNLDIGSDFSGKRTMTCVVSKSDADSYFEGSIEGIDTVISTECPDVLTYEKLEEDTSVTYTFYLEFSSYEDYKTKIESLLGRTSEMEFRQPDSVFSSGAALSEDFDSRDLLYWFKAAVEENNLVSDSSKLWELSTTVVVYDGEEMSTGGTIQFDRVESNPISKIEIETFKGEETIGRTVSFVMPAQTRDAKKDQVDAYMEQLVPQGASGNWQSVDEGYRYEIVMVSASAEEFVSSMRSIFGDTYTYEESVNEEDPFYSVMDLKESFETYAFCDASYGLQVIYTFDFEEKENREVLVGDSYGWMDENRFCYDEYYNVVDIHMVVYDRSTAQELRVRADADMQAWDFVIDLVFAQTEEAQKAADYYSSQWEGVTAEAVSGDGEICRITCLADQCNVSECLEEIFSGTVYYSLEMGEETMRKDSCNIVLELALYNLANAAGIDDANTEFVLQLDGYEFQEVYLDDELVEELSGKESISVEGRTYVFLRASAEKTKLLGILLTVLLVVVVVLVVFAGFVVLIKYLSKRDGREDEPFTVLVKSYLMQGLELLLKAILALVAAICKGCILLANFVRDTLKNYYPEGSNHVLVDYFYGSRYPVFIWVIGVIIVPVVWIILRWILHLIFINGFWQMVEIFMLLERINVLVEMVMFLSFVIGLVWRFVERSRTNPEAEAEYDRVFARDLEKFKSEKGLNMLGLVPEEVALVEPLKLVGPDDVMRESKLSGIALFLRKIVRVFVYQGRLIIKQGADGKSRYSCASQNIWYFSENQLCLYEISYDLCTGAIRHESTCEVFYQDLANISTHDKVIYVKKYFKRIPRVYQDFTVTTNSGEVLSGAVDSGYVRSEEVIQKIKAMEHLARDRKEAVVRKKRNRGNKV